MIRIFLHEKTLADGKFLSLCLKSGSRFTALGIFCDALMLAEQHLFTNADHLIPLDEWKRTPELDLLVDVGLAEVRAAGVFVLGSQEQLKWIQQRRNAGKTSAALKLNKRTPATKNKNDRTTTVDDRQTTAQRPLTKNEGDTAIGQKLVAFYCERWQEVYGAKYVVRPQDARALKDLGKTQGLERVCALIGAYLKMPDQWFLTKRHDVATFLNNLAAVSHHLETGKHVTRRDVRELEDKVYSANIIEALRSGDV